MLNDAEKLLAEIQRLDELLQLAGNAAGAGVALAALLKNTVQQNSANATVIAAGGAITPDAVLTTKGPLGKIRVSANFSGVAAATLTPFLTVAIGANPSTIEVAWKQDTGPIGVDDSAAFEITTGAPPGTAITVHWQTTALDGNLTLGDAATPAPFGAVLLVEELPS